MKRNLFLIGISVFFLFTSQGFAQVVNEKTKKKISIGVGLYTDIMMKMPTGIDPRVINQGMTVFGTYNIPFGKSDFSFAIGLGLSSHNIFGNYIVNSTPDSTTLNQIPDSINYKKSKINVSYLEVPIEFRFKSKKKVSVALGFKGGIPVSSSWKYVGDGPVTTTNFTLNATQKHRVKFRKLENIEQFSYGPTLRVGYKWFNVYGYYMISQIFTKNKGPEMYPISVGFVLMPF